jgi:hypothetical protein
MIAGCSTVYVAPDKGDTATLTFVNWADRPVTLQGFKVAADCSGGKLNFNEGRGLLQGERLTIRVKADEAFSFAYIYNRLGVGEIKYALQAATFIPGAGRAYEAPIVVSGDRYAVAVNRIDGPARPAEPSFTLRNWHTPLFENGPFCEPLR